ncbi:hypothetical protein LDP08_15365, partial [Ralstonia pseudosolanacearum]|uniref:hypothetical protein n=1 Tax=Ralstonia pseudosolanacearum TaxID=1310165 RepID=UPI003CED4D43
GVASLFLCRRDAETRLSYRFDIDGDRLAVGPHDDVKADALAFMEPLQSQQLDFRIPYETRGSLGVRGCPGGRIIVLGVRFDSAGHGILPKRVRETGRRFRRSTDSFWQTRTEQPNN